MEEPSSESPKPAEPAPAPAQPKEVLEPSSTGLEANVAGLLSYALGFVTGIVFLVLEKRSSFVRFHAFQSTVTFGGLFLIQLVGGWLPLIGGLLRGAAGLTGLVLWIVLMVKAYQGERWQVPVVGEIAEERSRRS